MKTYYQVTLVSDSASPSELLRFETLSSLDRYFHEYLKSHLYDRFPNVFVTRFWQLKNRFFPAGVVGFHFGSDPHDIRNNRWIHRKIRSCFDGEWVFNWSIYSFVPFYDQLHFLGKFDFKKWKVSVHDNEELPF